MSTTAKGSERIDRAVKAGTGMALETPLREPILEAVEERAGTKSVETDEGTGRPPVLRGAAILAVLSIIGYAVYRRKNRDE